MSDDDLAAGLFFDVEIAPHLRQSGTPEDAIATARARYIPNVIRHPIALRWLRRWSIDRQHAANTARLLRDQWERE